MFAPKLPSILIDRVQAIAHLTALGYKDGDVVFLRLFFPDGDSRKEQDKGRKLESRFPDLPWGQIEQMQAEGRGCYFVVNGIGHTDASVTEGKAVFYEHDDLSKDLQRDLWKKLGLPEPTAQVDSGGKSIHNYWKLTTPCTPDEWRKLQEDLLEFADGDRKLKNPSRVLRLAGAYHLKPGREPVQSQLIFNTGKSYIYEDLRRIIPRQQVQQKSDATQLRWHEFEKAFNLPIDAPVPLYECLTRSDRDLIDRGASVGGRNAKGFALAANLVSTTNYLADIGQKYEGDARLLFEQYCQNCAPPIDSGEVETIWNSANKRATSTSLPPNAIEACIKSWQWRQLRGETSPKGDRTNSNVVDLHSVQRTKPIEQKLFLTEEELEQRIDELINQNLQPSKLTAKLNSLSKETNLATVEVKRIYQERLVELEQVDSREERSAEVDELLKFGNLSLKLAEELPAMYAQPLIKLASHLKLKEELYLLALLTGLSICHRTGTELVIHRGQDFSVPLNLFSGIVAESGQRKSPVVKAICTKPLRLLQREAKAEHKAALTKYESDQARWESFDKEYREAEFPDGRPQQPTQQKLFFFTSTSGSESINRQIAAHPEQPLLYLKDELMGVFTQQGKYSQGRGSEKQDFLSYFDGTGSTELLADGVRSDTETILLSIMGTVQPEVLRKFSNNCTDPDGQWARFLWVSQPLAAADLENDDGGGVDVTELLAGLYRRVNSLAPVEYTLSRTAFKLYQRAYNHIEQLRVNCPDAGLRAVYSKMTGQLGRLAANCHVLHEMATGKETPATEIPLERVAQGVRLIQFFIEQVKLIRSDSAAAQGELSDVLVKIIKLSQRLGRIKAKQVQKNYESIKLTPDQIRNTFLELAAMGHGPTYGQGNRLEWEYQPTKTNSKQSVGETVGAVGETVGATPTSKTTPVQGFQETVGAVGAVGDFSKKVIQSENIGEKNIPSNNGESRFSDFSPTAPTTPTVSSNPDSETLSSVGTTPTDSPTAPTAFEKVAAVVEVKVQLPDEPDDDNSDDDPDGGGSGNVPVTPTPPPTDDDGGGSGETLTEDLHPPISEATEDLAVATSTLETSQQLPLALMLVESQPVPVVLPDGVEWLDPDLPNYQEQCQVLTDASIVALDVETYQATIPKKHVTPKALHPWQSQIRLIQLCTGEKTYLIDFGDRTTDLPAALTRHQPTINLLKQVIQNPDQKIVGHNIHFDLRFLATKLGIRNAKNVICTRVGAQVFYGDYGKLEGQTSKGNHEPILVGGYSLANLAKRLLDISLDKQEQKSDWGGSLTSEQIKYAALDPTITLQVYHHLESLYIDEQLPLYSEGLRECWQLECDAIACAVEIELTGLPLDVEAAKEQLNTLETHRLTLLEEWAKLCPNLNYTQRDKLLNHLNGEYQLGLAKLDKGSLDKQARENPIIQIKLKLQGLDALANNLKGFLASAARDGRVHTTYKTLTGTGRFSSGGNASDLPNLQAIKAKSNPVLDDFNLPSVREVIKPQPGRTMAVVDLAGAHGRIAASETQDETAIAGNNDPNIDNHLKVAVFIAKSQGLTWTAEYMGKVRKDSSNPDSIKAKLFRDTAKNTYYGWLNGAGPRRIQEQITANTGNTPALEECQAAIEGCKALYPGVLQHRKQLMERLRINAVNIDGRLCAVNTTRDGFRICLPLVESKFNDGRLEAPYTQSIACIWSRIEATAVKRSLVQIMRLREQHPEWNLNVVNYVHDEIDIEVNSEFASDAVPLVNDIIGDSFAALLNRVDDGREKDWGKLVVTSWADK